MPQTSRFCSTCGESLILDPRAVGTAVAREDRLSDSGARELQQLLVEAVRGEFQIHEELGRGGMAVVYRATDVHLSRTVAIKVLPPELTFARGATERFRREAKTAAALDHPNIIPIYRIASGGKLFWYAMKFLEGRSLSDVLQERGRLAVPETIKLLQQVADALDYAHGHGVIHRDIKPGNVMLDQRGRVTVTDFGIAKELSGGGLTGSGALLGTPNYMSPEQCRGSGSSLTGAADQYAVGVMAYQLLSGQLPFEADSAIDVIHKHVMEPPPPLEALVPDLPRYVVRSVNRAMSKRPEERFPTVTALVNAMRNIAPDDTLILARRPSPFPGERRGTGPGSGSSRQLVAIVAGILVFGGSVWAAFRLAGRDGRPPAGSTVAPAAADPAGPDRAGVTQPVQSVPGSPARPDSGPAAAAQLPQGAIETASPAAGRPARRTPGPGSTLAGSVTPAGRMGYVVIRTRNSWANITIAGPGIRSRAAAERTVWSDSLPAGTYTATLSREGWQTKSVTLRVRAGQDNLTTVVMTQRSQP